MESDELLLWIAPVIYCTNNKQTQDYDSIVVKVLTDQYKHKEHIRSDIMRIDVYFSSGACQTFIVHKEILVIEFQYLAEKIGGCIKKIKF